MVSILYLEVESFAPLDAVQPRDDREIEAAPPEERQAYQTARARDHRLARGFREALWNALRSYFGEGYLPPLAVVEAYCEGNERPYSRWDLQVSQDDPDQITTLTYDSYFEHLFIQVDHGGDHQDLLIPGVYGLKLFFCPREGRHADMEERLLRQLLAELAQRGLSLANLSLLVAFVDGAGLHTAQLPAFLEQIGA